MAALSHRFIFPTLLIQYIKANDTHCSMWSSDHLKWFYEHKNHLTSPLSKDKTGHGSCSHPHSHSMNFISRSKWIEFRKHDSKVIKIMQWTSFFWDTSKSWNVFDEVHKIIIDMKWLWFLDPDPNPNRTLNFNRVFLIWIW